MCLQLKRFSIKRLALTDKICYKFIKYDYKGRYVTPYQDFRVSIGKTYESKIRKTSFNEIEEGLHSFANYEDCKGKANTFYNCVVVKCIIPKGSWYYIGKFSNYKSYSSNRLKYVEIINN